MPTTRPEAEPTTIETLLDGFDHLVLHRYPHVVGPPFVALLALGLAEAAFLGGPSTRVLIVIVAVCVGLLALDSVLRLPGRLEKLYGGLSWAAGLLWTVAAAQVGPMGEGPPMLAFLGNLTAYSHPVPPMLTVWALILVAAWPPWTNHRRVRRSVRVSAEILAWDGDAVGLPEVRLSTAGAKCDGDGWEAPLIPDVPGKWTTDKLRKALPNIASHYGRAVHEFTIDKVRGDREGKWVLRFREARKREPVLYAPPVERPSARKPFPMGTLTSDPTVPLMSEVWRDGHGGVDCLITGQKGYGKSTALKRISLHAIAARDGLLFLGDMKPGSPDYHDLGSRGAYLYVTNPTQLDLLILILLALCDIRGRNKRRNRKVIFLVLDEMKLYFAPTRPDGPTATDRARAHRIDEQRLANFEKLAVVSRAFDISIWLAVQKGKEKNTGGEARSAISAGQVIGFYSPKSADSALVAEDREFDLTALPKGVPGQCLVQNAIHPDVVRGTLWKVDDGIIRDTLDRFGSNQGGLDEDEVEWLQKEFGDQFDELRLANREKPLTVDEPEPKPGPQPTAPQSRPMTAEESREYVWECLAKFPRGASLGEIVEATGKSKALVGARLRELRDRGRVAIEGTNRWTRYHAVRRPQPPNAQARDGDHTPPPTSGD